MTGRRWGTLGALLVLLLLARYVGQPEPERSVGPGIRSEAESAILDAFAREASSVWVEAAGTVDRTLPDDDDGSRHQRFILRLPSGHTVLISHNIDLAPRIESLSAGDVVSFRGEYEWNRQGGVVHWTHHDPAGNRAGGWLERAGRRYR